MYLIRDKQELIWDAPSRFCAFGEVRGKVRATFALANSFATVAPILTHGLRRACANRRALSKAPLRLGRKKVERSETKARLTHELEERLGRKIAYCPLLARLCGSVTAGIMLSQARYWNDRTEDPQGWFYKTAKEWKEETALSLCQQVSAREKLRRFPFWQEALRKTPATLHFRLDLEKLLDALAENPQTRIGKSGNLDQAKHANKNGGESQASSGGCCKPYKEAETTREHKQTLSTAGAALKAWLSMKHELRERIAEGEWKLWARPAYLLREMDGGLLLALPPGSRLVKAARGRLPLLRELARGHGYNGVGFTRYPDNADREQIREQYPEFYEQMLGNKKFEERCAQTANDAKSQGSAAKGQKMSRL